MVEKGNGESVLRNRNEMFHETQCHLRFLSLLSPE